MINNRKANEQKNNLKIKINKGNEKYDKNSWRLEHKTKIID